MGTMSEICKRIKKIFPPREIRLFETLVVRDEEDMIERHIRFHHAMGVDAFIVSSHNSVDRTNEILRRLENEGLVVKIFYRTEPTHMHKVWVKEMIECAKRMGATWVLNADVDEFYYSKYHDLKKSIGPSFGVGVLHVDSMLCFPEDGCGVLGNHYFVTGRLTTDAAAEACANGIASANDYVGEMCPKDAIHRLWGFKSICDGNHRVKMWIGGTVECDTVRLYHYSTRSIAELKKKAARWAPGVAGLREGICNENKDIVHSYESGDIEKYFDARFGRKTFEYLLSAKVLSEDTTVIDYLKENDIYDLRY